ncbi:MAG: PD-(D/E)XK nuclease family protein [Ottowia sp.]|nr:PD-(D/E)XK nuclease family protein [Ottowia sp.]
MSTISLSPSASFLDRAITQVLPLLCADQAIVVVPTASQIMPIRRAMQRQLGACLLPRVTTLENWLLDLPPLPDTPRAHSQLERLLHVQQALKQQSWLRQLFGAGSENTLWGLAHTLLGLCDELSAIWLPYFDKKNEVAQTQFASLLERALERAYAHLHQRIVGEEAQLLLVFWRMLTSTRDPVVIRWRQLQRLAQHDGPLIWISCVDPNPLEAAFLDVARTYVSVANIRYDWQLPQAQELLAIWPELQGREHPLAINDPHTTTTLPHFQLINCPRFEDEAVHAATFFVEKIQQGARKLALVAQDRIVARRIRALLARANIPVRDETGWKLSTTRAAATLMRWFDLLDQPRKHIPASAALLDWLKSPFVLAERNTREQEVALLEQVIRRDQIEAGWSAMHNALHHVHKHADCDTLTQLHSLLQLLESYTLRWLVDEHTLYQWCRLLEDTLDGLGMRTLLMRDIAGVQLLATLQKLSDDMGEVHTTCLSLTEFRALLALHIENAVFREIAPATEGCVTFLPLNGARMRCFDAILMVGCDERQLPATQQETLFFSCTLRKELGLPDQRDSQRQQMRDLAELLLTHPHISFSWQNQSKAGESQSLSPWLIRLSQHVQLSNPDIHKKYQITAQHTTAQPSTMPVPSVAAHYYPTHLSAHSYNALRRCPYQFFAHTVLALNPLDELDNTLEKRDVGLWLHDILYRYHQECPPTQSLAMLSESVFNEKIRHDGRALSYWQRWQTLIPDYLNWQTQRTAEGWHWQAGEVALQYTYPALGLTIKGRIDRIDHHPEQGLAVLDYKVQSWPRLQAKRKVINDDIQLPFYALLLQLYTQNNSQETLATAKQPTSAITKNNHASAIPIASHSPSQHTGEVDVPISTQIMSAQTTHITGHNMTSSLPISCVDSEITEAGWIALDGKRLGMIDVPNIQTLAHTLSIHIQEDFSALFAGAGLPASGEEKTCRFCQARGLCRKGYWESP